MLSIKGAGFGLVSSSGGGVPGITPQVVSAILGHLSKQAACYARLKYVYCQDDIGTESWNHDFKHCFDHVLGYFSANYPRMIFCRATKMSELVLLDELSCDGRCFSCNGAGQRMAGASYAECSKCGGSGRFSLTQSGKAEYVGLKGRSSWIKSCSMPFDDAKSNVLYQWDRELKVVLREQLEDHDND